MPSSRSDGAQSEVAEALDENEPRREPSARVRLLSRSFRTFAIPPFGLPPALPLTPLFPIRPAPGLPGLRALDTAPADAEGAFEEDPFEVEPARISSKRGGRGRIWVRSYNPHLLQTCQYERRTKLAILNGVTRTNFMQKQVTDNFARIQRTSSPARRIRCPAIETSPSQELCFLAIGVIGMHHGNMARDTTKHPSDTASCSWTRCAQRSSRC